MRFLILIMSVVVVWVIPVSLDSTSALVLAAVGIAALGVVAAYLLVWPFVIRLFAAISAGAGFDPCNTEEEHAAAVASAGDELERGESLVKSYVLNVAAPVLAIEFFAFWTLVFMFLWSLESTSCPLNSPKPCSGAFLGFGVHPSPRDFLYLAVNGFVANIPPDFVAHSAYAHLVVALEFLTGLALVTAKGREFLTQGEAGSPPPPSRPPTSVSRRTPRARGEREDGRWLTLGRGERDDRRVVSAVWVALISVGGTLAGGGLGAWAALRAGGLQAAAQVRRDLDRALSDYLGATVKAVAAISRVPDVDPQHWFHRFSNVVERGKTAALGPTVGWTQTEAGVRRVFGDRPFAPAEAYVDAAVRLRVLDPGAGFEAVMESVSDYLIELGQRRTQEVLDQWPDVHRELTAAIQQVRASR